MKCKSETKGIIFVPSWKKIPNLKGRIGEFLSARSLLALYIDRLIEHYKMLIIIQLNQYFYAREGENQPLADEMRICFELMCTLGS